MDEYVAELKLKDSRVLDIGTAGDPLLPGASVPSEKYHWFGEGNQFETMDNDPALVSTYVDDICTTTQPDNKFDLVILSQTLEHVWNFGAALKNCHRLTKKWFIVDTPFMVKWHPTAATPDYWRFTRQAYEKMLPALGFEIVHLYASDNLISVLCKKS